MKRPAGGIGRDAFWSLLYLVAIRAGAFVLSVIVARLLGTWGIGAFGIALQVAALASLVGGMNLATAVGRELPKAPSPQDALGIVRTSAWAVGIGGTITGLALALLAPMLATRVYGDARLSMVLVGAGVFAAASSLYVWAEGAQQGLRWFRWQTRWGVLVAVTDVLVGTLAALRDLTTMLVVRAGIRLTAVSVLLVAVGRALRRRGAVEPPGSSGRPAATLRRLLAFAGPLLLSNVLALGALSWMRVIVTRSGGVGEAGYYQAADTVVQGLALVPLAAATAFLPSVAHAGKLGYPNFDASLGRAFRRVTGINLPLCMVVAGLSAWLPGLVFGAPLAPAGGAMAGLAAASGMIGLATMFGATILGRGEVWYGVAVNAAWALTLLGLMGAGFDHAGARGASIAVGGSYLLMLMVYMLIAHWKWNVSWRLITAPMLANLGAWLAVLACGRFFPRAPGLLAATCGVIAAVVFFRWAWPEFRSQRLSVWWTSGGSGEL